MKNLKTLILLICLIVPFSFVGCENQNKTSLSTPATLTIDDGIIIFDAVADAEYYIMDISGIGEIKLDARYSNNVEIIDGKIHYNATKVLIPGETYNIKVKATASARGDSPYTSLVTYGHMQTLDTPTNVKINGTTLTWDVVENASYYVVKLITPQNKNIFDYDGNLLTKDDAESIKNAELTEYTFYTNQFNFDSLLSSAGIYKFYVSAVRVEPAEKIMSDYSSKMTYKNIKTLSTPINGTIALVDGDLHLTSVVDKNANAITVKYADTERTVEINSANTSISISGNIVDINLSKFFPADILDLDVIKQYSFKVKANYINSNENNKYYTDSEYSNVVVFENTYILSAPDITLSQDVATGYYEVSWDSADNDHVKKYEVFVFTPTGLIQPIYQIEPNENETKNKFLITTDFVSVAVRAVGAGNYITSPLSEYAVNPDISNEFTDDINFTTSNNTLHWDTVDNAYYFVQFGDLWTETNLNSCAIPVEYCTSNDYSIYVTVIKDGYIPQTLQVDLSYNPRLTAPYIANGQGFSSRNLYELSFTGSNKALGYYVYIKSADASEYVKIDTLYTSTTIDISKYITSKGEYYVCIESVADPYSIYKNSALSSPIPVTHEEVLDTPQFDKIGDEN